MRSGPQLGALATEPVPSGGGGVPIAFQRERKLEVAHSRANWLYSPYRMGAPQCFRAGNKIRKGQQVGQLAIWPLPFPCLPTPLLQWQWALSHCLQ